MIGSQYVHVDGFVDLQIQKLAMTREDVPAQMRDTNKLSDLLPVVDKSVERLVIR